MALRELARKLLPRGSFARGVSVLASGTVAGQAILLLAMPVLTRLYTPKEFGVLAVFAGLLGTLTVVSCLRFEMAIPLPKREGAAFQVVGVSLIGLCVTTTLIGVVGLGPGQALLVAIGTPELVPFYWLLPLGVLLGGIYQLSSLWAVRRKAFAVIAKTQVQQGFGTVTTQIGLGVSQSGALGLILGQVAGQALGLLRLGRNVLVDYRRQPSRISRTGMTWAAFRFRRFAQYDTPAALLNTAGAHAPAILFAAYTGPMLAGFYLVAIRVLSAPIYLVGRNVSQVLLPDLVRANREGHLAELVRKTQRLLATLSLGPFFVIALLAPQGFGYIFGPDWVGAGDVAAWTAVWVAFQFIYSPLSTVLPAVEAQKVNLALQVTSFVARVAAIYLCFLLGEAQKAVMAFSLVSMLFYVLAITIVGWKAGLLALRVLFDLAKSVSIGIAVALPVAVAVTQQSSLYWSSGSVILAIFVWVYNVRLIGMDRLRSNGT